jgi:MoxR-like ATPase
MDNFSIYGKGGPDKEKEPTKNVIDDTDTFEGDGYDIADSGPPDFEEKEGKEEEMPALELVEISRSKNSIAIDGRGNYSGISNIETWHDQTIVVLEGSPVVSIYDERGIKNENFSQPLNTLTHEIDWHDFAKKFNCKMIMDTPKMHTDVLGLREVVPHLRQRAKRQLGSLRRIGGESPIFHVSRAGDEAAKGPWKLAASMSESGKFIIATNEAGDFVAYVTETEKGDILDPRNWKRFDTSYMGELPSDVGEAAEKAMLMRSKGYVPGLTEKYFAMITNEGIEIGQSTVGYGDIEGKDNVDAPPVFTDKIPSIEKNFCRDPENSSVFYYCSNTNPRNLMKLDLEEDPGRWQSLAAEFPKRYDKIDNLEIDPSGAFFVFSSGEDLVFITKDTLEEVRREPGLGHANFNESGNMRAVNEEGYLITYKISAERYQKEFEKRRIEQMTQAIDAEDIFRPEVSKVKEEATAEIFENLEPAKDAYKKAFEEQAAKITDAEGVQGLRQGLIKLEAALRRGGMKSDQVEFIIGDIESYIQEKEKIFATERAQEFLGTARRRLSGPISMTAIFEARAALETLETIKLTLDDTARKEFETLSEEYKIKSSELFSNREAEIIKDVQGILVSTKRQLEGFESKSQMDDWINLELPKLKRSLGDLQRGCPLEAEKAYNAINRTLEELANLSSEYGEKFKRKYAAVREKAVERIGGIKNTLEGDISWLVEHIGEQGFTSKEDAEKYLLASGNRKVLEEGIEAFKSQDPETAKALDRSLKSKISNVLTQIEQGAFIVGETGQQMVVFGETQFPKWEAKVQEKGERRIEKLTFEADERSRGPGVKAGEIMGDVMLLVSTPEGTTEKVRLYEGLHDEDERRLGLGTYRGEAIPPSYVTASEFTTVNRDYNDWKKGEKSNVRKELLSMRNALRELYSQRQKPDEREAGPDEEWQKQYRQKLEVYSKYYAEHNVSLLKRIDRVTNEPQIEDTNGKGFVPEWQSHWTMDPETERNLEKMAQVFQMQLTLHEGLLNLKGHAGTGKDVAVKMFAARTNRPYFATDCSKWTTEFELSEDVALESKDGASQTVKVPSAVLNGITTPGGIVYFNEINSMPEQAQIFLHSLMDEKRALTLKTSSGKVVKADPSVLLVGSMNPGYPGTFDPQLATRSRMVDIEIGYPNLMREAGPDDTNSNPAYTASEALRIAREVDSLSDITYESDPKRNKFVQIWDRYINGIDNGAQEPTGEQKFDIDTILSLVQFADKLRGFFVRRFEKTLSPSGKSTELDVSQPITGRDLRRCAYKLSQMKAGEKATANPESVAREFINELFVSHIDKTVERDKINTAMSTWTSQKRMSAGSIEE